MQTTRIARYGFASYALWSVALFGPGCAVDPSTGPSLTSEHGARSVESPRAGSGDRHAAPAPGGQVGHYDSPLGFGLPPYAPPIIAAGGTPVDIADPSAAALANLDVLMVFNSENVPFDNGIEARGEYVSRLADIDAAVQNGLILVIHDRGVDRQAAFLPGGSGFTLVREFTESLDVNLRDTSTEVTTGLTDASLDNGGLSNHGYALDTSLPPDAKLFLTSTTPSHVVSFCYPYGLGAVIYSTIPLDAYLRGESGIFPGEEDLLNAMVNIYAPNVVRYALDGACKE